MYYTFRNCVDNENSSKAGIKIDAEKGYGENANKHTNPTSSHAQPNIHHNENTDGKGQIRGGSIKSFGTESDTFSNYRSGRQVVCEPNLGDKSSDILNSCIQSSETEPLVNVATTGNGSTHPV